MRDRLRRVLAERGGLVVLCVLAAYVLVAPAHITNGDNPEFATLSATGGAAHPTGYPLYILWLRLWSWLPFGSPAHVSAIATCLLGASSMLVLHAACRAWGASALASSFAVAMVAASPMVLRVHTEAEVFALNGLVAGSILWIAASENVRGARRVVLLALIAGLGISDHVTCVLVAPVGLWGAVRGVQETSRHRALVVVGALGALIVGLLPYLYLVVVPETRGSWGKVDGLAGLVHHFLRRDYGGPGELARRDHGGRPVPNILALVGTLARCYLWLPFVAGFAMLGVRAAKRTPAGMPRLAWQMLALSWLLAGPVLMSKFNLPPTDEHAYITRRFHILPSLLLCVPVAAGLDWLAAQLPARLREPRRYVVVFPALVALTLIAVALPRITAARSVACERALHNMLAFVPPDAVIMGSSDEFGFGMGYLQGALHERPDVLAIMWPQIGLPFARERVRRATGISIDTLKPDAHEAASVAVARQLLATGRPLYIDGFLGNIARSFPVYPYGLLFRVLPPGSALPTIEELFAINKALFAKFVFDYPIPHDSDIVPAMFHGQYARTWQIIAEGLGRAGKTAEQEEATRRAFVLAPEN